MIKKSVKNIAFLLSVFMLTIFSYSCNNPDRLFEENSDNWMVTGDADWSFAGNVLKGILTEGAGFVVTKESFKDFVLEMEFYPDSTINSGVFIRCEDENLSPVSCYEINIWDTHPNQDNRTGSIVNKFVPLIKVQTIGQWNTYKIESNKNHIQVWVNDILTADLLDQDHIEGSIGLQARGSGEIRFRNIEIKEL